MAITTLSIRDEYTASAKQRDFTYTFELFDADEIDVFINDVEQTRVTDYTVSGVGNDAGGTVTYVGGNREVLSMSINSGGDGAGGTAYMVGDNVTLDGSGFGQVTAVVINVDAVDGNGDITTFSIVNDGEFTSDPQGATLTQASTTGTGTGATFDIDTTQSVGLDAGDKVVLVRNTVVNRVSDFQQNGKLLAVDLNTDLDRIVAMIQEEAAQSNARFVRLSTSDTSANLVLPTLANRTSKFIFFDSNGDIQATGTIGTSKGDWTTSTVYNFGDIVRDGANGANTQNLYFASSNHTSGTWATDLSAGKWTLIIDVQQIESDVANDAMLNVDTAAGATSRQPASGTIDIGASGNRWSTIYATTFDGTTFTGESTEAKYADLAERYEADDVLQHGDVVKIGGEKEITKTTKAYDKNVFGVVSAFPAYKMNAEAGNDMTHPYVALAGRVPVKVTGKVEKGQRIVTSDIAGVAMATTNNLDYRIVIGRALQTKNTNDIDYVECVIGAK